MERGLSVFLVFIVVFFIISMAGLYSLLQAYLTSIQELMDSLPTNTSGIVGIDLNRAIGELHTLLIAAIALLALTFMVSLLIFIIEVKGGKRKEKRELVRMWNGAI